MQVYIRHELNVKILAKSTFLTGVPVFLTSSRGLQSQTLGCTPRRGLGPRPSGLACPYLGGDFRLAALGKKEKKKK